MVSIYISKDFLKESSSNPVIRQFKQSAFVVLPYWLLWTLLSAFWFGLGIFLFFIRFVTKASPHHAHEDSEDQKRGESRGQPNDHIGGSPHPAKT